MTGFRSTLRDAPAPGWRTDGWTTPPASASGWPDGRVPGGRRRSVPHLLVGALLVVACAVGFAVAASSVDHRAAVLALARPVTVGQRLTSGDLRSVRVSVEAGVATIPASMLTQVAGEQVAVSLPSGALLARAELGPIVVPPGQAIVAVAVKVGQAPPSVSPGEHVLLVAAASTNAAAGAGTNTTTPSSSSAGAGGPWPGVVTDVASPSTATDTTVVSVQLADTEARAVAALPAGQIDLVVVPGS